MAGVSGGRFWDCRSAPTMASKVVPEVFTSLTYRLMRTEFAFERSKGEWLAKKLGVPPADPVLQQHLRAAGLFEELRAARQEHPGKLAVQVEMGKAKAPTEERFRELLDRAVRIAEINAEVNPAA
jgi:hypothetical protein